MNSEGHVLLKTKIINIGAINKQIAIRNILFVIAISLLYLSAKYYQAIHQYLPKPQANSIIIAKKQ
jgi:hypothetical protein